MHASDTRRFASVLALLAAAVGLREARADGPPEEINVLSWGAGALVVQPAPAESRTGQWSADALLDEMPDTGWANPRSDMTPKVLVFELAARSRITSLIFDTAQTYSKERAAKDVKVELSDRVDGGFVEITKGTLDPQKDGQKLQLSAPASGRYLRLTVLGGYGDPQFMEIMNVKALGAFLVPPATRDHSGMYHSDYGDLHLLQNGNSVVGCYQRANGLVQTGVVEGRVLRFTWSSDETATNRWSGPALLIFPDDGATFLGHFWHGNTEGKEAPRDWQGTFATKDVGFCPNWKPSGGNEVEQQLQREGRARLYGILFDTDSDHLKPESKSTLDALVGAARNQPTWKFTIEGHTDNAGTEVHNQTLSEQRAAAVKAVMTKAGIDGARLPTQGFGATRPVANNGTSIGRAQNRRVEVVTSK